MLSLGIFDILTKKYGEGPSTHNMSVDSLLCCIFSTATFDIVNRGCLSSRHLLRNHRGILMDISNYMLFGYNSSQSVFRSARHLKWADPRVVTNYLTYLHSAIKDNDLFHRINKLHQITGYPLTKRLVEEYESIDMLVYKLMDESDYQWRKLHTGITPWLPAYKNRCFVL